MTIHAMCDADARAADRDAEEPSTWAARRTLVRELAVAA